MRKLGGACSVAAIVAATVLAAACGGSAAVDQHGGGSGGTAGHGSGGTGGANGGGSGGSGASGECGDVCAVYGPACCVPAIPCPSPGDECVIDILEATIGSAYSYADLEQQIDSLPSDVAVSIADTSVEAARSEPPDAARIELVLTPAASAELASELPDLLMHPIIVRCGSQRMFVGLVYELGGAAALAFPVLNVEPFDPPSPLVLRLGAWQGAWLGIGWDWNIERHIDHPQIRGRLCHRGVLAEMSPGP